MQGNSFFNLTDTELHILHGILNQISVTMRPHKGDDYALSRCSFLFEFENGMYDTFLSVMEKIRGTAEGRTARDCRDDRTE
jgi:hypothetical protein